MNILKTCWRKLSVAFGLALCGASAFAEGAGTSNYDFSLVTTELTNVKDALVDWVKTATPILLAVMAAFMIWWLIRIAWRALKGLGRAGA